MIEKLIGSVGLSLFLTAVCVGSAQACDDPDHEHTNTAPSHARPGCYNSGSASASGVALNSPGVLSGNVIQAPISIPLNVCGNSINVGGLLNGVGGGGGANGGGGGNN
ncbi:chaplin [Streptomyces sp. NPDC088400]|uniref:chaplin n=1 Tax=Streptomyces sp. NPDC088400 TaxID=3365861 RepID=UPI00381BA49B